MWLWFRVLNADQRLEYSIQSPVTVCGSCMWLLIIRACRRSHSKLEVTETKTQSPLIPGLGALPLWTGCLFLSSLYLSSPIIGVCDTSKTVLSQQKDFDLNWNNNTMYLKNRPQEQDVKNKGSGQTQSKQGIPGPHSRGRRQSPKHKLKPRTVSNSNKQIPSTSRTKTY